MSECYRGQVNWLDEIEDSPVCLIATWKSCKARLILDEYYCSRYSAEQLRQYKRVIQAWGKRLCRSSGEYERLLTDARQKVAEMNGIQGGFHHEL